MNIITLDLGTITGFASVLNGSHINYGTVAFSPNRYEGGGMRFLRFNKWLEELHNLCAPVSAIYFEEVRAHKGVDASHVYGGFLATLTAFCEQKSIPYQGVPVGVIKKNLTGNGTAKKTEMVEAVKDVLKVKTTNHNEADALALLYFICPDAFSNKGERAKICD